MADSKIYVVSTSVSMFREYSELCRLRGGHAEAITAVAISPLGAYVATAAADNKICIWEISSHKILHEIHGSSYAVSLVWAPSREDQIFCGMADGYVTFVRFSKVSNACLHIILTTLFDDSTEKCPCSRLSDSLVAC